MAGSIRKRKQRGDTNHLCTIKPVRVQSLGKGKGTRGYQKSRVGSTAEFGLMDRGRQWLRYCATNQKFAGSIPDGVMEFFIDINPSDRNMALGSTQPLTEMSTRCISWGVNAAGA
jgi:hypothetical protein